jgi:hypothetical protein
MPFGVNAPGTAKPFTGTTKDKIKTGAAIAGGFAAVPAAVIAAPVIAAGAGAAAAAPGFGALGVAGAAGLGAAAKFVKGFGSKTVAASNASRGVVVNTAKPVAQIGSGTGSAVVRIPRLVVRPNAGFTRPAPAARNAGKIAVAAGAAAAGTAGLVTQGMRDARRGGSTSTSTPTSKPTTSSAGPKRKDLAYFTAEAKKKGKTGKGVSNYAYTMFKDYKMRTGTSARTGARISGTKPKEDM